jgi:hypothetical protein
MRVSSTESLDYYEEYRSGKKVGTHPASSPRDSGQRRRAVDSSTSLDSHVTTVRGLIAGTGKRSELILLGVQGTAVGTDVPWTTMVALSPMSPMVGGRSERDPGVGNPAPPGTRTGGTRTRSPHRATARRATSSEDGRMGQKQVFYYFVRRGD